MGKIVVNGVPSVQIDEAVLFPFDDFSIPLRGGLKLHLISGEKYSGNPVVRRGKPGEPDCLCVRESGGTVVNVNGEYRMWYLGRGNQDKDLPFIFPFPGWFRSRACYAVSRDGFHWGEPALNLVEYGGSTKRVF